jgi:hypothetical protein
MPVTVAKYVRQAPSPGSGTLNSRRDLQRTYDWTEMRARRGRKASLEMARREPSRAGDGQQRRD